MAQSLDDLLVDEEEFNESMLTEVLAPYVRIGDDSGTFMPTDAFDSLSAAEQTAVVLLYRKAAHELDLSENDGGTPMEISEASGINYNTVKTAVRDLDDEGLVANDDGEYSIPGYNFDAVREFLQGDDDEC